ncbi:MAG: hypothetical protein U0931_40250 [Vulcanimicrobiota bacterium]
MRQEVGDFLSGPSPHTYRVLCKLVLSSSQYRPDSDVVDQLWKALDGDQLELADQLAPQLIPTFLVNPRAHLALAYLHGKRGDERGEQFEYYFSQQLRRFLLESGDGSREQPYQVTSVDEVHYVAGALEAKVKQVTCEWLGGRLHDVLVTDQGELYFSTQAVLAAYS